MSDFPNFSVESRPEMARDPWSSELDQVRATVQALQGAATLLQGAMEQRQGLASEMRTAEQRLSALQQQQAQAEQALSSATAQLERMTRDLERVRSEQNGLLADFDRLVQGALARRGALLSEIADLERQREGTSPVAAPTFTPTAAPALATAPAAFIEAANLPARWDEPPTQITLAPEPDPRPEPPTHIALAPEPHAQAAPALQPEPLKLITPAVAVTLWPPTKSAPVPAPAPTPDFEVAPEAPAPAPERPRLVALPAQPQAPLAQRRRQRRGLAGLRTLFTVTLGAMLVGLAVLLTPVTQLAGGLQLLAVMSGSMEPTIHVGGIVGVLPTAATDLKVGDVITFANQSNPDVLVTHRIVAIEPNNGQQLLTTQGDANDTVDAVSVPVTRAVGRVDFTLPWLGYLMVWLSTPLAKLGILAVSVIGFALPSFGKRGDDEPASKEPAASEPAAPAYAALEREIDALLPRAS
jgi:signal peptidase I